MKSPFFLGMPSPAELHDEPQRAILSALDANLVLAIRALKARHPDLDDHSAYGPHEPLPLLAEAVLACALSLHTILTSYDDLARRGSRLDCDDCSGADGDIPF
ncbi:MAG: hypothetical protein QM765_18590 [Myxococcales bacterium]